MNVAARNLWQLVQRDRLVRWAAYACVVVLWFAIAWADVRVLVFGVALVGICLWYLLRQREKRGWLEEPAEDIDLL